MPEEIENVNNNKLKPIVLASEVKYETQKVRMMDLFNNNSLKYGDYFCNNPDTYINHFNRRVQRWETYTRQ